MVAPQFAVPITEEQFQRLEEKRLQPELDNVRRLDRAAKDNIKLGMQVRLQGLARTAELNGVVGRVFSNHEADGKYLVDLLDRSFRRIKVSKEHLEPMEMSEQDTSCIERHYEFECLAFRDNKDHRACEWKMASEDGHWRSGCYVLETRKDDSPSGDSQFFAEIHGDFAEGATLFESTPTTPLRSPQGFPISPASTRSF
jgi:hypothetical protein